MTLIELNNVVSIRSHRMNKRQRRKRAFQSAAPRQITQPTVAIAKPTPEDWGVNAAAIELPANADVDSLAGYNGRISRAERFDVFALLSPPRGRLERTSLMAVRRLQKAMATLHRTQGAGDAQRTTGKGATGALAMVVENFSLARIAAGAEIDSALAGMKPWAAKLIRALCEPEVIEGRIPNWHAIVTRHTGEMDRHQRGELVRQACDDLAESYRRIDNEPKRDVA